MPRIAFAPEAISFADDPSERGMAPFRQNLMNLAQTFATDIPRLQMEQQDRANALAQQERNNARQDELMGRQRKEWGVADQAREDARVTGAGSGLFSQLNPTAVDANGDGTPDMIMGPGGSRARTTGISALPAAGRAAKAPNYDQGATAYAQKIMARRTQRGQPVLDDKGQPTFNPMTGGQVFQTTDEADSDYQKRLATIGAQLVAEGHRGDPFAKARLRALFEQGWEGPTAGIGDPADDQLYQTAREMAYRDDGEEAAGMTMGAGGAPGALVYTKPQIDQALVAFEQLKQATPEARLRAGYTDDRMAELYQRIQEMQASLQPATPAPAAEEAPMMSISGLTPDETALSMNAGAADARHAGRGQPAAPAPAAPAAAPVVPSYAPAQAVPRPDYSAAKGIKAPPLQMGGLPAVTIDPPEHLDARTNVLGLGLGPSTRTQRADIPEATQYVQGHVGKNISNIQQVLQSLQQSDPQAAQIGARRLHRAHLQAVQAAEAGDDAAYQRAIADIMAIQQTLQRHTGA
jgi:hypothetical protein